MNEEPKKDYSIVIAKKAEKLVTALYLVTDLASDQEPIKHSLRKNAVALLSSMNSLAQLNVKDRVLELKLSLKSVTEILSLLHVAVTTGIVSEMNGELLLNGFRALQLVLEKKQPLFTKEMLIVEGEDALQGATSFQSAVTSTSYDALTPLTIARLHDSKEELRRTQEQLRQSQILRKFEQKGELKEEVKETQEMSDMEKTHTRDERPTTHSVLMEHVKRPPVLASSFQMKKMSRREQILSLFVKGVDVSIKDIASRIKGCSEKTIQRELNALLYDNVIERIGEKRWSRYVLK
jgi:Asp-tRNA(Asn)/Glu-tRNA(Gln) amidotransferase C subunit